MKRGIALLSLGVCLFLSMFGCSDDDGKTWREVCDEMGDPSCESIMRCNPGQYAARSDCVDVFRQGCCGDEGKCGDEANIRSESAFEQCKQELREMSCQDVEDINLPASCDDA